MNNRERVTLNRVFSVLGVVSVGVLIFALVVERVGCVEACRLCKLQRIPYALIGLNSVLGIFTSIKKGLFRVIRVCLVVSCLMGGYHAAVQLRGIKDPCVRKTIGIQNPRDYTALLASRRMCFQVSWDLLGMPLSLYNVFLSLTLPLGSYFSADRADTINIVLTAAVDAQIGMDSTHNTAPIPVKQHKPEVHMR